MRILHRTVVISIVLNKMGVTANIQCDFCNDAKDRLNIFFEMCLHQTFFVLRCKTVLKEKCETAPNVTFTRNLLFVTETDMKTDTVFDLVTLQVKHFTHKCTLDKCFPTLFCFFVVVEQLMLRYKTEECNSMINGELSTCNWN